MKTVYDILRKPIITEKSTALAENFIYTFEVDKKANKSEIKNAVEKCFNVKVVSVKTVNVDRKAKRMQRYEGFKPAYKKAVVRLVPGQKIEAFEI